MAPSHRPRRTSRPVARLDHPVDAVRRRCVIGAGAALLLPALAGCGGGDTGDDRTKARLRFVNASAYADGLDLVVDDSLRFVGVGYGSDPGYVDVDPDATASRITRSGSPTTLVSLAPALARDRHYTMIAWGAEGALSAVVVDEEGGEPAAGDSLLSVLHAAPDADSLDVYVTRADETLAESVPAHAGLGGGTLSDPATLRSGTWRLRVTTAGSKTDVRLDLPAVTLDDEGVATLVITGSSSGHLVNALLLRQRGAVVRGDNPEARVRLVAGVPGNASVRLDIDGAPIVEGLVSPLAGDYARVPAGVVRWQVAVDGGTPFAAERTLPAGSDQTLVVFGEPPAPGIAPALVWLDDDNRRPDDGQLRLRLVHALDAVPGSITLAVDLGLVAGNVERGTASDGVELDTALSADLLVRADADGSVLYEAADQALVAGSVYSLFLTGDAGRPAGILRRDRR
jgi:hypothetical protein